MVAWEVVSPCWWSRSREVSVTSACGTHRRTAALPRRACRTRRPRGAQRSRLHRDASRLDALATPPGQSEPPAADRRLRPAGGPCRRCHSRAPGMQRPNRSQPPPSIGRLPDRPRRRVARATSSRHARTADAASASDATIETAVGVTATFSCPRPASPAASCGRRSCPMHTSWTWAGTMLVQQGAGLPVTGRRDWNRPRAR